MNRFWLYLFLLIVINTRDTVFGQEQKNDKVIVLLDPGHGGADTGAIGINGILEKDIVLGIAKAMIRLNSELYNDTLALYLTRYSDTLISLGHRTKLAKALKVDVFVSIHCNQAERKAAQGIEVYVGHNSGQSVQLANSFTIGLNSILGFKNRGVKQANFLVLRETNGFCPGVLLELGFLSNKEEANNFEKKSSISAYALLILDTVVKFLGND